MSTHIDKAVVRTHDAYQEAVDNLVHHLHVLADELPIRLAAFDDDGHMRHYDHASGLVSNILSTLPHLGLTRLLDAAVHADSAINSARRHNEGGYE